MDNQSVCLIPSQDEMLENLYTDIPNDNDDDNALNNTENDENEIDNDNNENNTNEDEIIDLTAEEDDLTQYQVANTDTEITIDYALEMSAEYDSCGPSF